DPRAAASHEQTARLYQLYTEIFADRGAICVSGDIHPVVASLVKMQTGLSQVSAAGYLKQAEEIFAKGNVATEGLSHPETFIRARSLVLWQEKRDAAAPDINHMIEGVAALDELDLIGQMRLTAQTRRLLEYLLRPRWFQTPTVLGHAKLYFSDFQAANGQTNAIPDGLDFADARLREYLSYVLLDFAKVDPELDDMPLAATLHLSQQLELDGQFEKLAAKELKLRVRDVKRIKEQAAEMLAKAEANGE
ncbi:MAG TPA: peptidase M48, partial [Verrucomicrobiae bacterium]